MMNVNTRKNETFTRSNKDKKLNYQDFGQRGSASPQQAPKNYYVPDYNYGHKAGAARSSSKNNERLASDGIIINILDNGTPAPIEAKRETFRLASFKQCPVDAIQVAPLKLAMAGFYYVGPNDRVKCFCCGMCVESFTNQDNALASEWHKSDCKFLLGEDSGNIQLGAIADLSAPRTHPRSAAAQPTSKVNASIDIPTTSSQDFYPVPSNLGFEDQPPSAALQRKLAPVYVPQHEDFLKTLNLYKEAHRRSTFNDLWPEELKTLSEDLAKSGFFFLGNLDRTQCISCGAVLKNWSPDDDVSRLHAGTFERCRLARNEDPENIPISEETAVLPVLKESQQPSEKTLVQQLPQLYQSSAFQSQPSTSSGLPINSQLPQNPPPSIPVPSQAANRKISQPASGETLYKTVEISDLSTNSNVLQPVPSHFLEQFLNDSDARPGITGNSGSNIRFHETARLQIPAQSRYVHSSKSQDQMYQATQTIHSQTPELIRDLDPFAAVTGQDMEMNPPLPASELDVDDDFLSTQQKLLLVDMYPCQSPQNPGMVYLSQRISTFRAPWPSDSLSPLNEVASAGFYYLGDGDNVCCWYCGIEVSNWATRNHAWKEHAKLHPSCQYLLRNRGVEFVESVLTEMLSEEISCEEECTPSIAEPSSLSSMRSQEGTGHIQSGPDRLPTPPSSFQGQQGENLREELIRALNSELAAQALTMGFTRRHIRKVVKRQVMNNSCNYQTMDAFLEALITTEQDLIDLSDEEEEEPVQETRSFQPSNSDLSFEDVDENADLYRGNEEVASLRSAEPHSDPSQVEEPEQETESVRSNEQVTSTEETFSSHSSVNEEEDRRQMQDHLRRLQDERRCKVCLDRDSDMVFVPCGHICSCMRCTQSLRRCPVCRKDIQRAYRTYKS
ncbi:inhibitor of apoptosis protein-like isoform X2 [Clavelina lepadiformis]|uniref:inhibitor of apoptosis protein-like isoform X2 n=1 Tax=Clavelina lepadiformis TaxID=159417 RepID=UPI004042380F